MRYNNWLLPVFVLMFPLAALASASRITAETTVVDADGVSYVESQVICRGSNEPRKIRREKSQREWCATEVEGVCAPQKIRVARAVCGRPYAVQLKAAQEALGDDRVEEEALPVTPAVEEVPAQDLVESASMAEKVNADDSLSDNIPSESPVAVEDESVALDDQQRELDIERERLNIERERMELRRQQVELKKQELEIQRQLEESKPAPVAVPAPKKQEPSPSGPNKSVLGM